MIRALAFFGGGTGGHLFPGIAVAERARERFPGCRAVFFRTRRAVEDKVFEGRGLETRLVTIRAPGKSPRDWMRYAFEAARARVEIERALSEGFDAAFGLGGYAALPGALAARASGVPIILLEQNLVPGKVNRMLAPVCDAVACSFEDTALPGGRKVVTGNPLRKEVIAAAAGRRPRAPGKRTILVVGGSQGARGLNRAVERALPGLLDLREEIRWIHCAGDADKEFMAEAYRTGGFEAEVLGYSPRLPELMAASDLIVGRAGGTTLSEIAAVGVPSLLVPFPHHADRHQERNAGVLARAGAAIIVEESELGPERLRACLEETLFSEEKLDAMSRQARALARPGAADAVIDLVLGLEPAGGRSR